MNYSYVSCLQNREADTSFLSNELYFFGDYLEGLACAKENGMPVLVVFTGYACVGYDEFKMDFITNPQIRRMLQKNYLTILLHVDEKLALYASWKERYYGNVLRDTVSYDFKTTGHLNSAIQRELFQTSDQPFYAILNAYGDTLIAPFGQLHIDKSIFLSKLQLGFERYKP